MKLSFVFLCLSLATLSLAAIPPPAKDSSLSCKEHRKPSGKKVNGGTPSATGKSSQATKKKPVKSGKKVLKKRPRKRVAVTKGVKKTSASAGKDSQEGSAALSLFPKVLVELIGAYLEGSFSVVFTRNWSAVYSWCSIAVDSERHYLITPQDIQASSHEDGKPMSLGSPDLSCYVNFHSSHDGRSVFFTGKSQEQVSSDSLGITARWQVQDASTKGLKSTTFECNESSFVVNSFKLSTNGKVLLSTLLSVAPYFVTTSIYQVEEHGKTDLASKKGDIDGSARAVSGNGNRILLKNTKKKQLEIHDISGDGSNLILEIVYAETVYVGTCALNNDGSKAAFMDSRRKLYIVDVDKEKGSVSVDQLTPIDAPDPVLNYELIYDAKSRLYAFIGGDLWLVDPSKRKFISLEKAEVRQGYVIQSLVISPNVDYIALLIRSKDKNEKEEYQFQMVVKRREEDATDPFMRLCGYKPQVLPRSYS